MRGPIHLRVFLSSPGDVAEERTLARDMLQALAWRPWVRGKLTVDVVSWDDPHAPTPLSATEPPQHSINRYAPRPSSCDLTIVIVWGRLGTPPAELMQADGTPFKSGTHFEIDDARRANKPVWIYRRTEKPTLPIDAEDWAEPRRQYKELKQFLAALMMREGTSSGGVNEYAGLDEFEHLLERHLEAEVRRLLDAAGDEGPSADRENIRSIAPAEAPDAELKQLEQHRKALVLEQKSTHDVDHAIVSRRRLLRDRLDIGPGAGMAGGRFEIHELLGEGGFGTVWKAYDNERKELVAIKVLHAQYRGDRRRDRFFRGAHKMAKLVHPGIVRVLLERGEERDLAYFVMEFLQGRDLKHRVSSAVEASDAERIIRRIAAALDYTHEKGMIHRDIKPANVLLTADATPKLTDFDLVHAADTTGGTRTGAMGTFFYAAPEAMQDAASVDARADLYSLGKVWAFMLYGRELPTDALVNWSSFVEQLDCDARVKSLLQRMSAWNAHDRYPSMKAFLDALELPPHPDISLSVRFIAGKYQGGEFPLEEGREIIVGRSHDRDMVLVEQMVSSRHAMLMRQGNAILLRDLNSTNGTFVNGERVTECMLRLGDHILIGTSILQLVESPG